MQKRGRISSIRHDYNDVFDFDPLASPRPTRTHHHYLSVPSEHGNSSSSTANESESVGLIWNNREELQADDEAERIKEMGQLATVFLQVRKGIMDDCNYDVSQNERLEQEREHQQNNQPIMKRVSKSTLHRAEKVKLMLNLFYFSLFQSQKTTNPQFKGVDGVYNPLQIIRNRSLRKRYRQTPQISVKTLTLASTAFSHRKKRILWEVELAELAHDSTWRTQHWHELVNPKGELWFPKTDKHKHRRRRLHRHHNDKDKEKNRSVSENLHDKLFDIDSGGENEPEHIARSGNSSAMSSRSSRDDLSDSSHRRRQDIAEKIRSKSPFRKKDPLGTTHKVDSDEAKNDPVLSSPPALKQKILGNISIEPVKPADWNSSEDRLYTTATSASVNETHDEINIDALQHEELRLMNSYFEDMRYLDTLINFGPHANEYKRLEYINLSKRKDKFDATYNEISNNTLQKLRSGILKSYESLLKEKSNELRDIQNELVNEYSTKIDTMLTLSDRTIGEVNTTLALEIRKLTERVERVGGPLHKKSDSVICFLYWLLENLVVVVLWSIWIGFSIGRVFKYVFVLIWRIIVWIMF